MDLQVHRIVIDGYVITYQGLSKKNANMLKIFMTTVIDQGLDPTKFNRVINTQSVG